MSKASGDYKATGRAQIVFPPCSLGVQNGAMGLHTALRERISMTNLSPKPSATASKPFPQFRGWGGGFGMGLGTGLGAKLAEPRKTVAAINGDGAWHDNPVPAALGFAREAGPPLMIVLCCWRCW